VSLPEDELVRARQRRAAKVTAMLLFAFIALTFFITIAKLTVNR
jgi:hypothetical protein